MQVKKFAAETIVQALKDVKSDLGPDAIILSTKEEKASFGQSAKFIVVAAVSENQLRKKQITEKTLGAFSEQFSSKSAFHQKQIISSVVDNMSEKNRHKNPQVTTKRYADILEFEAELDSKPGSPVMDSGETRVQSAVKEAFQSSLSSQFLPFQKKRKKEKRVQDAVENFSRQDIQPPPVAKVKPPEPKSQEQLSWPLEVQPMVDKLSRVGVDAKIIENYVLMAKSDLRESFSRTSLEAWVARKILDTARCVIPGHFSGIEFFVGPQGSGKTTSLVKVASEYRLNHRKRVVMVTTDTKKVAAHEQLKIYGRILNIPVFAVSSIDEWSKMLPQLESYDNILVDTPGVSLSEPEEFDFLRRLVNAHGRLNKSTHLVLSATSPSQNLRIFADKFQVAHYGDVIFSNIDQTSHHGTLLNFYRDNQKPFHSFGLSSDIVEGFEWATRERILDLIFKLTKINGASRYEQQL